VIWQYQVYVGALFTAALVSVLLSYSGWNLRNTKEGRYFAYLLLSLMVWFLFQGFEMIAQDIQTKILLSKLSYLGVVSVGPLFFIFIVAYTQQFRKWKPSGMILLWTFPLIVLSLAWTNEYNLLIWPSIEMIKSGSGYVARYGYGLLVYLMAFYAYILCIFAEFYLYSYSKRTSQEARGQIYLLMAAAFIPILGNIVYLYQIVPNPDMDLTPFSFLITCLIIGFSVFKYKLLDIVPIALDLLFSSMSKGVIATDSQQRIVAINPAAQKLLQVTTSVIGKSILEIDKNFPEFTKLLFSKQPSSIETEIENSLKSKWLYIRISPILGTKKESNGQLVVLEDITKRKETERNLQESKERFEQVAEQAREIIWEINAEGLYTYISPRIETIVGYKAEEIIGKKYFYEIHPVELQESIREEVSKIFEKKEIFRDYINEVQTKAGERLFFSTNAIPILDNCGKLMGYRGSDYDITMLKEMDKIKDDFINTVSHELRTPLTIIKESINIVLKEYAGPLNDEQKNSLIIGKKNVDRLSRLINDVLDIQKLQFSGFSMDFRSEDINQLVLEAKTNMFSIVTAKGLSFELNLTPNLPPVWVDHDRIMQVFTNLINNAAKFTNQGFILIKTGLWEDRYVKVTIQDSGIGISQSNIEKLFKRFSQIAPSDNQNKGGTGLGLAICKEIIEKHLGKIWVESEIGKGSSFCFSILLTTKAGK